MRSAITSIYCLDWSLRRLLLETVRLIYIITYSCTVWLSFPTCSLSNVMISLILFSHLCHESQNTAHTAQLMLARQTDQREMHCKLAHHRNVKWQSKLVRREHNFFFLLVTVRIVQFQPLIVNTDTIFKTNKRQASCIVSIWGSAWWQKSLACGHIGPSGALALFNPGMNVCACLLLSLSVQQVLQIKHVSAFWSDANLEHIVVYKTKLFPFIIFL